MNPNKNNALIGIAVITCNRQDLFTECIKSVPNLGLLIVINDGQPYQNSVYPQHVHKIIQHKRSKGVGRSKNEAFRFLLEKNCTDIFIIEDDVRITNPDIFELYIKAAETSGILHFNFAYHGPANKTPSGKPNHRFEYKYQNGVEICFHRQLGAAFSFFKRKVLEDVGLFNPIYKNANEHVEHTYRIIQANLHTPFWWFADIKNSQDYIEDLDPSLTRSVIRKKKLLLRIRVKLYSYIFKLQHRTTINEIHEIADNAIIVQKLQELSNANGNPFLF